jgi:Family of unknown function (DUF6326)
LNDIKVPVRFKLSASWCSVMFCYIYGDYFELYQPGKLQEMLSGRTALGAATQNSLMGMAAIMAVPSLMVLLSLSLPATVSRWLNVILGAVYSLIVVLAVLGSWHFYVFLGLIEIALSLSIVWYAWSWPKQAEQ